MVHALILYKFIEDPIIINNLDREEEDRSRIISIIAIFILLSEYINVPRTPSLVVENSYND